MSAVRECWGLPMHTSASGGATNYTALDLGTQNSAVAGVYLAELVAANGSETITKVTYRQGATTGTPAADSYRIGIQGVNTSGQPDGTWLGGGSPAYVDFTPAGANDNKRVTMTLTNSISINRGQAIAIVLTRTAATDASNKITAAYFQGRSSGREGFPYPLSHNGTSWSKVTSGVPVMGYQSADNKYGDNCTSLYTTQAFGSTTEVGFTFTVPTTKYPSGSTYKIIGVRWWGQTPNTSSSYSVSVYSSPTSGTTTQVASTSTVDDDQVSTAANADRMCDVMFSTSTLPALDVGTKYAVGLACSNASDMNLACLTAEAASDLDSLAYPELDIAFASRTITSYPPDTDTENFTETTTTRPWAELIIGDVTIPAGGGSGGGIRLAGRGGLAA